jgi:hypothetical protein
MAVTMAASSRLHTPRSTLLDLSVIVVADTLSLDRLEDMSAEAKFVT